MNACFFLGLFHEYFTDGKKKVKSSVITFSKLLMMFWNLITVLQNFITYIDASLNVRKNMSLTTMIINNQDRNLDQVIRLLLSTLHPPIHNPKQHISPQPSPHPTANQSYIPTPTWKALLLRPQLARLSTYRESVRENWNTRAWAVYERFRYSRASATFLRAGYAYMYICIYIEREKDRDRQRERERVASQNAAAG